jgi:asparagine N-glycosylation enzyme membrane subunit Stt3
LSRDADQDGIGRNLFRTWSVWIWFVGAAAWFVVAALSLHHHALGNGLLATVISALFLTAGMFFRKQARRGNKL